MTSFSRSCAHGGPAGTITLLAPLGSRRPFPALGLPVLALWLVAWLGAGAPAPALAQSASGAPSAAGLRSAAGAQAAATGVPAGDGTLYLGAFPSRIFVIDEATSRVVNEIAVPHGSPRGMVVSEDRSRFHFLDPTMEHLTTVGVASQAVTDSFTLSEGNRRVRIRSFRAAPDGRTAILHLDTAAKLIDRFEVEPYRLVQVDLATHEILQELVWPTGEPTSGSRMLFSPDGAYLYYFARDVIVLETGGFTEVDRWSLSDPIEPGMGAINFGFSTDLVYEEPGFFTNLFRLHDPAQDRDLMGIARIDLPNRDVDFYTLGPATSIQFALAPGRRTAYGLASRIEGYEFWTFDLEERRIGQRRQVAGRPRMALDVSTNGRVIYISSAGNTIDFYDAASFDYLDTLALDGDMTSGLIVMPSPPAP